MIELLAIPAFGTPSKTIDDWVAALATQGHPAVVTREDEDSWLEVASLRVRGYLELDGARVDSINFELASPDLEEGTKVLAAAAAALGWELHPDDEEEDFVDED